MRGSKSVGRKILERKPPVLLWLSFTFVPTAMGQEPASGAIVDVNGFSSDRGRAIIRLYPRGSAFPDDSAQAADQLVPIHGRRVRVRFADAEDGSYAVAVVHDENCDQHLTRGAYGVPLEGFGFSDRYMGLSSPRLPTFAEAAQPIGGAERTVRLRVVYPVPHAPALDAGCPAETPTMMGAEGGATGRLRLVIGGVDATRGGTVRVRLFATGEPFPGEKSIPRYAQSLPIRAATLRADFDELPPGRYAAIVLHDLNNNSRAERGEPLTYSGPVRKYGRIPRFQDAAIAVGGGAETQLAVQFR